MDRHEKARGFHLYTIVKALGPPSLRNEIQSEAAHVADNYPEADWLADLTSDYTSGITSAGQSKASLRSSLFDRARRHLSDDKTAAFTVAVRPHYPDEPVDLVMDVYDHTVRDFRAACGDFFILKQSYSDRQGRRKSSTECALTFSEIDVWTSFRMQQHSTQDPSIVLPVRTIQALPPTEEMPYGRGNTVLIKHGDCKYNITFFHLYTSADLVTPIAVKIMQIRIIFALSSTRTNTDREVYLYGDFFTFTGTTGPDGNGGVATLPAQDIDQFTLRRHVRTGSVPMSDVVELTDVLEVVQLVPRFGAQIDRQWDCDNSLALGTEFFLNNFANKNTFHAVLTYQ